VFSVMCNDHGRGGGAALKAIDRIVGVLEASE
jgi:hypothetical protein